MAKERAPAGAHLKKHRAIIACAIIWRVFISRRPMICLYLFLGNIPPLSACRTLGMRWGTVADIMWCRIQCKSLRRALRLMPPEIVLCSLYSCMKIPACSPYHFADRVRELYPRWAINFSHMEAPAPNSSSWLASLPPPSSSSVSNATPCIFRTDVASNCTPLGRMLCAMEDGCLWSQKNCNGPAFSSLTSTTPSRTPPNSPKRIVATRFRPCPDAKLEEDSCQSLSPRRGEARV